MSVVFQKGDMVRIAQLPLGYLGIRNLNELKPFLGLELKIEAVGDGGQMYGLQLLEPVQIGRQIFDVIPVHHTWVEAILEVKSED
jgi:hypothetical protein